MPLMRPLLLLSIATIGAAFVAVSNAKDRASPPVDRAWRHQSSRIALPETVGGLPRQIAFSLAPSAPEARSSYGTTEGDETLSIDIFRNMSGDVPLWFSQVQRSVESLRAYDGAKLAVPPTPFGLPALGDNSGLLAVYDRQSAGKRQSIGVALVPVGDWYVHVHAVSFKRGAVDTAAWVRAAMAEVKFPPTASGKAIRPITGCTDRLAQPDGLPQDVPSYGLVRLTKRDQAPDVRIRGSFWCLDSKLGNGRAVYRPIGTNDRYLLATDHLGGALSVRGEAPTGGTPTYYSIVSIRPRTIDVLAMLDRLPTPRYALDKALNERVLRSYATWPPAK